MCSQLIRGPSADYALYTIPCAITYNPRRSPLSSPYGTSPTSMNN